MTEPFDKVDISIHALRKESDPHICEPLYAW